MSATLNDVIDATDDANVPNRKSGTDRGRGERRPQDVSVVRRENGRSESRIKGEGKETGTHDVNPQGAPGDVFYIYFTIQVYGLKLALKWLRYALMGS